MSIFVALKSLILALLTISFVGSVEYPSGPSLSERRASTSAPLAIEFDKILESLEETEEKVVRRFQFKGFVLFLKNKLTFYVGKIKINFPIDHLSFRSFLSIGEILPRSPPLFS